MIFRHLTSFLSKHGRISKGALERSLRTNLREKDPCIRAKEGSHRDVVVTLDPNKFAEKKQQPFQIGGRPEFRPHITLQNQSSLVLAPRLKYDDVTELGRRRFMPYPPDTKAFLYYFRSPEKPRIAAELRLRVVSSDDASFESGSDLLKKNGQTWSRPLYVVSKRSIALYEKLREEQLVSDDLDAAFSTFPHTFPRYRRSQYLYTLTDTFIMDFEYFERQLTAITEQGMATLIFNAPFLDNRGNLGIRPYTGSALVRFERSTFPAHKGTRTVVLRFIKIITPVKCVIPLYDGYIVPPEEGMLHRRYNRKANVELDKLVWSVDIDKRRSLLERGLQLLWDI